MENPIPCETQNGMENPIPCSRAPTGLAYMFVRSERKKLREISFCSHNKNQQLFLLVCWHFNLTVREMASTAAPPDSAPRHPVVILEISTDSQPVVEDEDDDIPMFPNRYVDIDNKAIGGDFEMPAAKQKFMKVLHNSAEKYANLNFSIYF